VNLCDTRRGPALLKMGIGLIGFRDLTARGDEKSESNEGERGAGHAMNGGGVCCRVRYLGLQGRQRFCRWAAVTSGSTCSTAQGLLRRLGPAMSMAEQFPPSSGIPAHESEISSRTSSSGWMRQFGLKGNAPRTPRSFRGKAGTGSAIVPVLGCAKATRLGEAVLRRGAALC